jgi:hypothetical protein
MILVWAYLHAMQYLVIWSGNIPDEVTWYLKRSRDGWQAVLLVLSLGQLIFPFFALVVEKIRGDRNWLLALCALTLLMRCCEAAILILPAMTDVNPVLAAMMLLAGSAFVATVLWWMFEAALTGGLASVISDAWLRAETGSK